MIRVDSVSEEIYFESPFFKAKFVFLQEIIIGTILKGRIKFKSPCLLYIY